MYTVISGERTMKVWSESYLETLVPPFKVEINAEVQKNEYENK